MDGRVENLKKRGDKLFTDKQTLNSLHQEIAENFYPERADFTVSRWLGEEFAGNLTTSYPLLARRDMGNILASMLRPQANEWFHMVPSDMEREDYEAKRWLQSRGKIMRRAMYDRQAQFVRATKEADHDFVTFGSAVISVEMNYRAQALLFRTWHLRDMAWSEDYTGQVGEVHRQCKNKTVSQVSQEFNGNISKEAKLILAKNPMSYLEYRHCVMPASDYEGESKFRTPFVSIYYECQTGHVLKEEGASDLIYAIPRWQTVSGSQYAYSPCTVAALPDARLIQAMTLTLLEAGEKAVNPPLIATEEAVRSDLQMFAGGVTYVDREYDERIGAALRPLDIVNGNAIPLGMDMREDIKQMIAQAFYLDKLNLPPSDGREMTAYETQQRMSEYIRNALPLFETLEQDYNAAICEMTFNRLLENGAFGPNDEIPQSLQGADVQFRFESPLREAIERKAANVFVESSQLLAQAAAMGYAEAPALLDAESMLRDALEGIGVETQYIKSKEDMAEMKEMQAAQQEAQQAIALLQQGGMAAEAIGKGGQAMQQGGMM